MNKSINRLFADMLEKKRAEATLFGSDTNATYLNDETRHDICIKITGREHLAVGTEIVTASKTIAVMREALTRIAEQGGDITEKWSAEIARTALFVINEKKED